MVEVLKAMCLRQVGRESPADIVVAVPTVSTRHAMLRLGDGCTIALSSCQHVSADTALLCEFASIVLLHCLRHASLTNLRHTLTLVQKTIK